MDDRSDPSTCNLKESVAKVESDSTGETVESSARKRKIMCYVRESFPQIEIPSDCIHIIKSIGDWETVAEVFLQTVRRTKVLGYYSIYQLTSSGQLPQHPTSVLQVATIDGPILLFRLNLLDAIPLSLKRVLADPQIIKVGVGIFNLARRLEGDHDLIVSGTMDLRAVAEKVDLPERIYMSLPDLSKAWLGKDLAITSSKYRAISARVSYWKREELRPDQVHYAAVFAYGALNIFLEMISAKIPNFKTDITEENKTNEAWIEARTLLADIVNQDRKFTAYYCEICDVNPGLQKSYDSHIAGSRHQKNVEKLKKIEQYGELGDVPPNIFKPGNRSETSIDNQLSETTKQALHDPSLWCSICGIGMPGVEAMKQHMVGKRHKKNVSQQAHVGGEIDGNTSQGTSANEPDSVEKRKEFTCDLCDLTVPTKASMEFHLNGQKHKKRVARKEKMEEMMGEMGDMLDLKDVDPENDDGSRRYCDVCEIEVHNNHNWLVHLAGKNHKKNKEKLNRLEVHVNCNSEFGSKRPTVKDLSGSVYCGICNTTVMASKENLENHFQGKKHQAKLREKVVLESAAQNTLERPKNVNLTRRMADLAQSVVGNVTDADVGSHDSGIYCKVCRTIVCGGKDDLLSHCRGKKHLKNQEFLGKHQQPFKFPKAKSHPYNRPKPEPKPLPWQNSDINDLHSIPGVPAMDFENPTSNKQFMNNQKFSQGRNRVTFTARSRFNRDCGHGGLGSDFGSHRGLGRDTRPSIPRNTFTAGIGVNRGYGGGNSGSDIRSHLGLDQNTRPNLPRNISSHDGNHSRLNTSSQFQGQGYPKDIDAINELLHDQAVLAELEETLTGSRNMNVADASRGGDESRGRGWYGDRHHPYT